MMTNEEKFRFQMQAYENRILQIKLVTKALIKLQMMGLTLENGMIECEVPEGISPPRWRAMLNNVLRNPENVQ